MISFAAPTDDILFSLTDIAGADRLDGWDTDIARDVIGHFAELAEGVIAPLNASGDTQGARLDNGRVRMPVGFDDAYQQLIDGGWQGLTAPEAHGGMGLSPVVASGISEVFSGANHAMQMVCNLVPGAITTLRRFGTKAQQETWIPRLVSGKALSTMCLTEPSAGSDLSTIKTKAVRDGANWQITGDKIFISGGDQDMSDDILHLVLARSGSQEDGIKGLSLFLCHKQPAARVTRIEEKLGLHASPTCQMVFDAAEAELIGDEGAGLKAMFTLMNHARIDVALQGVAHAARAAQISSAYAAERKQGRTLDGSNAVLSDHEDVRRMLDTQQILSIGARAMCHIALVEMELKTRPALAEFLTPLCKISGSEAGINSADLGMQILGGYGYLKEYGIEQIWRDARITSIYEGANGIHARSLVTRGLHRGGGADEFESLIDELADNEGATLERLEAWRKIRAHLAKDQTNSLQIARLFAKGSERLLMTAVWARIGREAEHSNRPSELRRLAKLAQGEWNI